MQNHDGTQIYFLYSLPRVLLPSPVVLVVLRDQFPDPFLWRLGGVLSAVGQDDHGGGTDLREQLLDVAVRLSDGGGDGVVEGRLTARCVRLGGELRRVLDGTPLVDQSDAVGELVEADPARPSSARWSARNELNPRWCPRGYSPSNPTSRGRR